MAATSSLTRLGWARTALALTLAAGLFGPPADAAADRPQYVLALNWQPAFCETRPEKPECLSQTQDRFDASHFTVHGLWPQPRGNVYCGVPADLRAADEAGRWEALPPLDLTQATRAALNRVMPGTASFLHRHQWIKHGTCYGGTPEAYFRDTLALAAAVNASSVRDLFVDSIGREISGTAIRERFDAAFGASAGNRITVGCRRVDDRRLIVWIRIEIAGPVTDPPDLPALLAAAPAVEPGCPSGVVDQAGPG